MNEIAIVRMSNTALFLSLSLMLELLDPSSVATRSGCEFSVHVLFCVHPLEVKQQFQQLLHLAHLSSGHCPSSFHHLVFVVGSELVSVTSTLQLEADVGDTKNSC